MLSSQQKNLQDICHPGSPPGSLIVSEDLKLDVTDSILKILTLQHTGSIGALNKHYL